MRVCVCERERERERQWGSKEHGGRASIVADMITCLDLSYGKNKTSISPYLPFNQIPTFFASLPQNCHRLKISPFLIKELRVQLISRLGEFLFRNFEAHTQKKDRENTCIPPSGKLLLTFNLFRQEMESSILTTVNRGTGEERCNQAAHQLQGLHPVTFNSHSDHTICSAWYAHAIPIAGAAAISASSSSYSSSSVSFLITTEHFHTSLVPHMKQITAKVLFTFLLSLWIVALK